MLYCEGSVAPSPLEARAMMWAEIENTAADGNVCARWRPSFQGRQAWPTLCLRHTSLTRTKWPA